MTTLNNVFKFGVTKRNFIKLEEIGDQIAGYLLDRRERPEKIDDLGNEWAAQTEVKLLLIEHNIDGETAKPGDIRWFSFRNSKQVAYDTTWAAEIGEVLGYELEDIVAVGDDDSDDVGHSAHWLKVAHVPFASFKEAGIARQKVG